MDDGRFHNNGWMQECPDPITKITWDNAILMSRRTAVELGDLKNEELIEVNLEGRKLTGPVWIQPGMPIFHLVWPWVMGVLHQEESGVLVIVRWVIMHIP